MWRSAYVMGRMVPRRLLACSRFPSTAGFLLPSSSFHTQHIKLAKEEDGEWLFPVSREAHIDYLYSLRGTRRAIMALTFNTAKPLSPDILVQALTHLQRKLPALQVALRPRGDALWYFRPAAASIDFQVSKDVGDMLQLFKAAARKTFTLTDPVLWRATLVPREAQDPCPVPHVRDSFPHQYDFAFILHYAVIDGLDCAIMFQKLVDILEKLLAGVLVADTPCGVFTNPEEIEVLKQEVKKNLLADHERIDAVRRTLPPPDAKPLLLHIAHSKQESEPSTKLVQRIIDKETTKKFQQTAKQSGVSFTSALIAANNIALVEMAKSSGLAQDYYTVTAYLSVTLRHYLPKSPLHRMGKLSSNITYSTRVSKDMKERFWTYAAHVHQEVHSGIRSRLSLEQIVVRTMNQPQLSVEEYAAHQRPPLHDYGLTNLGDFSASLPSVSKDIRVTRVFTCNEMHAVELSNLHMVFTFEGKTSYNICYDTQYLSDDDVTCFIDQVMAVIRDVSGT